MNSPQICGFLADFILVVHLLFISFVVVGLILILIGGFTHWAWVRNIWFRLSHLAAIAFVVAQSWCGEICPLTSWESALRERVGQAGYSSGFIEYWVHKIIFFDASPWVFTIAYTVFGGLVLLTLIWVPPRWRSRKSLKT